MLKRSTVKAIEEVKMDLNILRLHCGNRIRDAVFRKFSEIKRDSNIEIFQKEVLLRVEVLHSYKHIFLPITMKFVSDTQIS